MSYIVFNPETKEILSRFEETEVTSLVAWTKLHLPNSSKTFKTRDLAKEAAVKLTQGRLPGYTLVISHLVYTEEGYEAKEVDFVTVTKDDIDLWWLNDE